MKNSGRRLVDRYLITEPAFYKSALTIIIPVVIQSLINQGVNMMDTVMVGRLGEVAISASSLANQFYTIFNFLCMGISAAGLVLASQYWGAGDKATVRRVFDLCMQIVLVIGTLFAISCVLIPGKIMRLYIDDAEVIEEGAKYLRVTALVFLPHGLSLVMSQIIRSTGNARLGLWVSCISFVVNLFANYVFIFGKLGMPAMGVMGAAVGTLCARVVEFAVCFYYMLRIEDKLHYRLRGILKLPKLKLLAEFRRLGMPAIISDTILGLCATVVSMILGRMGREIVSAYSIVNVMDRMCSIATMSVASASSVMIGHSVGSGAFGKAQKQGYSFTLMSVAIGLAAAVLVLLLGTPAVGLFQIEPSTREIAVIMMRSSAIVVFFQAIQSALSKGILRGGGDTKFLMVADIAFQILVSIPLGYLVGIVWKWPVFWVLIALRIDYIIKSVWLIGRLRSGKWIHKAKSMAA